MKRGWKDWPYWLRGGVIGGIIGIISSIILYVSNMFLMKHYLLNKFNLFKLVEEPIFMMLINILNMSNFLEIVYIGVFLKYLTLVIELSLLGIVIGFIYGKIKSRNNTISKKQPTK